MAHTWRIVASVRGLGYNPGMPRQRHYYGLNHLHFNTASTYRRARLFDSDRYRRQFVATLAGLRAEFVPPLDATK